MAELQGIKNYLVGIYVLTNSTRTGVINQLENGHYNELSRNYLDTYVSKLAAVTPADISEMARKYLLADKMTIVVVGDKSKITDQLKQFANYIPPLWVTPRTVIRCSRLKMFNGVSGDRFTFPECRASHGTFDLALYPRTYFDSLLRRPHPDRRRSTLPWPADAASLLYRGCFQRRDPNTRLSRAGSNQLMSKGPRSPAR